MSTKRTARVTGAWYLGLAVTGMAGFLILQPMLVTPGDPPATATALATRTELAGLRVALELGVVITQAVAAVYFATLFWKVNRAAAGAIAGFGLMNAAAIMASAAILATASTVAADASLAPAGDIPATLGLLVALSAASWQVGAVFFGLWLIPMGWVAWSSGRFPRLLGLALMVGGVGYTLSAVLGTGLAGFDFGAGGAGAGGVGASGGLGSDGGLGAPSWLLDGLTVPASIGEFWMVGYLLTVGIRGELPLAKTAASEA